MKICINNSFHLIPQLVTLCVIIGCTQLTDHRKGSYSLPAEYKEMGGTEGDYHVLFDSAGKAVPIRTSTKMRREIVGEYPKNGDSKEWVQEHLTHEAVSHSLVKNNYGSFENEFSVILDAIAQRASEGKSIEYSNYCTFSFNHVLPSGKVLTGYQIINATSIGSGHLFPILNLVVKPGGNKIECVLVAPQPINATVDGINYSMVMSALYARKVGLIKAKVVYYNSRNSTAADSLVFKRSKI